MTHPSDVKRLQTLLDATAEFLIDASDEEILEDISTSGEDPKQLAQIAHFAFQEALRKKGQYRLREAQEALKQRRESTSSAPMRNRIPKEANDRRSFLSLLMAGNDLPDDMTLAFREGGKELSDEEVLSALEDLADLGLLDDKNKQ